MSIGSRAFIAVLVGVALGLTLTTAGRLVETPEDVCSLNVRDPEDLAFVTQTTLSVDDTRTVVEVVVLCDNILGYHVPVGLPCV